LRVPSLLVSDAMLASVTGCALIERLNDRPALNKEYAAILVKVYGVPYLDEYLEREVGEAEAQEYGKIEVIAATGRSALSPEVARLLIQDIRKPASKDYDLSDR
jgi:hypothetical protein